MTTTRSNEEWLEQLRPDHPLSSAAYADLSALLVASLKKSIPAVAAGGGALAEDMTQESIIRISQSLDHFRGESRFTTWAISIAMRVTYSELRRAKYRDVSLESLQDEGFEASSRNEEEAGISEDRRQVFAVLNEVIAEELTDRQRTVLQSELEGIPQAALCEKLGINRNALYKLGHDSRKKLQQRLKLRGYTDEKICEIFGINRPS